MGPKGDLLELIDGAPVGVQSLSGSVWKWTHHERSQRAVTELTGPNGRSIRIARFGNPVGETTDEHFRVWLDLPDRWRFESDDQVDLRNGATRWIGHSAHVTELTDDVSSFEDTEIGMLMVPGSRILGALRFGEPTTDLVAGRPCLKVGAVLNRDHGAARVDPVMVRLGGVGHTYWFDEATGIVLRHVGLVDDEPCLIAEFKEVRINPPLTDHDFQFLASPGATVERQVDQFVRMAERRGVDLRGVDREDLRAVQAAVHATMRSHQPTPEVQLALQMAKHVPIGDPPPDEVAARESVEYAYNHLGEVDDEGRALVNVQCGRGLVAPLREAQTRVPGADDTPASLIVDDVKFLGPDHAVVWFSVEVRGQRFPMVNGREGRAVKVGDRWLIEHATIADLLGFAGVAVPAPDQ